jgi:beta-aspartyl-peptidase (threonine type)
MVKAVIAIHGGAGAITRAQLSPEQEKRYIDALSPLSKRARKCWKRAPARWMW